MNFPSTISADKTLDVRGKVCPMPVLLTKRKLEDMQAGAVLEIIGDYAQAAENIQRFAKQKGHEILRVSKASRIFVIYIKKHAAEIDDQ
jgi:tRNA 2-thiouridine synthesizing protein A